MKRNCLLFTLGIVLFSCFSDTLQAQTFSFTGTIARFVVPPGGTLFSITAKGAQGGQGWSGSGGLGAIMTGTFTTTPGHVLKIIAGETPLTTWNYVGGGGGGSFVWDSTAGNVLMLAAGGGGGGSWSGVSTGLNAVTTNNGTNGAAGATYGGGGTAGNGATTPTYARYGGGGTGWLSNGAGGAYAGCVAAGGGRTPLTGGAGGNLGGNFDYDGAGGFGGGGGAQGGCYSGYGGGGGGYSGGGGGAGATLCAGGGGGSFNAGSPQVNSVSNMGNGIVTFTRLCVTPTAGSILGPGQVCVAQLMTLTNPSATIPGTFGTATWSSSNPSIAVINPLTGVVTGNSPGLDTITYTVALTCGTASVTRVITVNPLPAAITGFADVCPGSTITLSDATPGGKWKSFNTAVGTIDSITGVLTGVSAGATTVSYTLTSTTGCATSRSINVVSILGTNNKVCVGDSMQLLASGTGAGTWSSSDISHATVRSTGWVTGVVMGTATISYTLPSGCVLTRAITINPLAPILGVDSVCIGSFRYLTDIVGGGIWSSDNLSTATVTSDSGKVFGVATGSTVISYVLPNGCKTFVPFHVIDYPPGILGITKACPGQTTTLSNSVGGGMWSTGNPAVGTVDASTGIVTGVTADTVDIFYTISPGCKIGIRVTINPLPEPITGRSIMCPNTKDTLYDASLYGVWSSLATSIASVDTYGVVSSYTGGNAPIRYTLPATGCYRTQVVTVNALPSPTITYNWLYSTLYATPGFATYQWYDSTRGKIAGATTSSIAATSTDDYYVEVTDGPGCTGVSAVFHYNLNMVGVNHVLNADQITVFPNPANDRIYIQAPAKVKVIVCSMHGKTEMEQENVTEMNISGLPSGMYLLSIYDEQGIKVDTRKLIKE